MSVSYETVRDHLRNIYEKLHIHSRIEAVARYLGSSTVVKMPTTGDKPREFNREPQ